MAKKKKKKAAKKKALIKHVPTKPVPVKFYTKGKQEPEKPVTSAPTQPKITEYPKAGPKIREFEDLLDKQLAGDTGPPKPKRGPGRPPKEKTPEPEMPELSIDVVAGVVKIPFELWAISQNVKMLALSDEEAKQMAEPAKQLLEYYLPQIPVIVYAWVSLSVSSFWIMRSRLLLIQAIKKQRGEKQSSEQPNQPAQPGVKTEFPEKIIPTKI